MGLKIRGKSARPMFFGFAEHKTFVEYFGVPEFAKPQTKTCSGLLISILPSATQRPRKGEVSEEGWRRTQPPDSILRGLVPVSRPVSLSLQHIVLRLG